MQDYEHSTTQWKRIGHKRINNSKNKFKTNTRFQNYNYYKNTESHK